MVLSVVVLTRNQSTWEREARGHLSRAHLIGCRLGIQETLSQSNGAVGMALSVKSLICKHGGLSLNPSTHRKAGCGGTPLEPSVGKVEAGGSLLLTGQPA